MKWEIYGAVNDGHDGMPRWEGELDWSVYYGGCFAPRSYAELIQNHCDKRDCVVYSVKHMGDYTNMNGEKFRVYEAIISPKYKYMRVKREFRVRRTKD